MKFVKKSKTCNLKLLNWRYDLISKYIEINSSVLDLGSGTGWLAGKIFQEKRCKLQLVDVIDINETNLPFQLYNGTTIPFKDRSFDYSLLVFVLHHLTNHNQIIQEVARVTRKKMVIVEDTPKNPLELFVNSCCDRSINLRNGMNVPCNYRKSEEWKHIFSNLGFTMTHHEVIRPFLPFYYTKSVFVLDMQSPLKPMQGD
jgi:ubiquinone/menaquinone biosynthesis C-methylase UbiE